MKNDKIEITKPNLIAVEGDDEVGFFKALLKHLKISNTQIWNLKTKDEFKKQIPILPLVSNFDTLQKLILVRDADYGEKASENVFKSLEYALKKASLPVPKEIGVFSEIEKGLQTSIYIMPFEGAEGMLEDLCLQSISSDEIKCIESFLDCMPEKPKENRLPKAKVQAFLAAKEKPIHLLGISAQQKHWDFGHDAFKPLRELLEKLR